MSISQPRTIFCFDGIPLAMNFFKEMISFLGISSSGSRGLATVCRANSTADQTLLTLSSLSKDTAIISSMKMSDFPISFFGMDIERSFVLASGMPSGREIGVPSCSTRGIVQLKMIP